MAFAELPAAGVVAGARGEILELLAPVFGQGTVVETLVVAPLDADQVHHAVHHRALHVLPAPGALPLDDRREDAGHEVHAGSRVADLRPGDHRRPSGRPEVLMEPPMAWATFSYALNAA